MKKWLLLIVVLAIFLILATVGAVVLVDHDIPPFDTTDLVPGRVEVTDQDNAFTYFNAATVTLDWPQKDDLLQKIIDGEKRDPTYVTALLAKNQQSLARLQQGLDCRVCQMPLLDSFEALLPHIDSGNKLYELLLLKAMHERESGHYTEALKTSLNLARFGDHLLHSPDCMVTYCVGLRCFGRGLEQVRLVLATGQLSEKALSELGDALKGFRSFDYGATEVMKREFHVAARSIDAIVRGELDPGIDDCSYDPMSPLSKYLLQPNRTKLAHATWFREALKNVPRSYSDVNMPDPRDVLKPQPSGLPFLPERNATGYRLFYELTPPVTRMLQAKSGKQASLAATRLVVACRRYEQEHGELPRSLDALAPKYLDAIPADPFDGKPFRYVRDRGVVYSVGSDLIDAGGSEESTTGQAPRQEYKRLWDAEDAVFGIH